MMGANSNQGAAATAASLVRQIREQRMRWVDLFPPPPAPDLPALEGAAAPVAAPPKRVRIIRPTEEQLGQGMVVDGRVRIGHDDVRKYVVGWENITGADLLGPAVGAADPVPFDPAVWAEYMADRTAVYDVVGQALLELIVDYLKARGDDRKN